MTPHSAGGGAARPWDVVVVGAGPAGSTAAHAAAVRGARVLLLDRSAFPRYKTCGGGLVGTSLRSLPDGVRAPSRASAREVTFTLRSSWAATRRAPDGTFLELVDRADLDLRLVEAAVAAGAEFRPRSRVRGLDDLGDRVVVRTGSEDAHARVVIGADGSGSRVAQHVGVVCARHDLGLEVELPVDGRRQEEWAGRLHLDWGPLAGSYGWVFPKGDRLTVGVIARRGRGERTREYLDALLAHLGLADVTPSVSSGHLTRWRAPGSPLRRGRVLVAGDAAGLLDPWTREGISFALRSGGAAGGRAAEAAAVGSGPGAQVALDGYVRDVERSLAPEMRAGARVLRAFERRPALFHAVAASPPGWRAFRDFCSGEADVTDVVRRPLVRAALALP